MLHIPNKKGICAHIFNVRALDAKQRINFFLPYLLAFAYKKLLQIMAVDNLLSTKDNLFDIC